MARMEQLFEFCLGPNLGLRSTSSFEDFLDHMALKTHRLGGVLRRGSFGAPSAAPVQTSSPPNVAHGSFLSLRFLFPGWFWILLELMWAAASLPCSFRSASSPGRKEGTPERCTSRVVRRNPLSRLGVVNPWQPTAAPWEAHGFEKVRFACCQGHDIKHTHTYQ